MGSDGTQIFWINRPMSEGKKSYINDRPHPGLLPQEKEKQFQRL